MTFLAEHAPEGKRGLYTSYAQIASFAALLTGSLVGYFLYAAVPADTHQLLGLAHPVPAGHPDGLHRLVDPQARPATPRTSSS